MSSTAALTTVVVNGTEYRIRSDEGGLVHINDKEVKVHPAGPQSDEKEVYEMTKEELGSDYPNCELIARLLGTLNSFYSGAGYSDIEGDGVMMSLFDGFVLRVALGKSVKARYIIEDGMVRAENGAAVELPSCGTDMLTGVESSDLIGKL